MNENQIKVLMYAFANFGLRIVNYEETSNEIKVYVSTPESSYKFDSDGKMMSGKHLASKFRHTLIVGTQGTDKKITVLNKVRSNEYFVESSEGLEFERLSLMFGE